MPQIQIGLGPVIGHIDFSMLEGIHRPRIHIDIRVQFLESDLEPSGFEKGPDGGRSQSFSQRRKYAAGYKNKFGFHLPMQPFPALHVIET